MKTTVEISDVLFERARAAAKQRGTSLRALIEAGLNDVLASSEGQKPRPVLRDFSFGGPPGSFDLPIDKSLNNRQFEIIDGELVKITR
ncbi:MAG: hypothetical protein HC858_04330 [Brachymonas sp.]|nr:hypothetical protein [Brachymonas sp.]